ncbi:hypothetical protein NC653_030021 [Populus alba x Populus x berolinensis]|uniref:Uncharacterized protein n=1 Tax=Populus alba x Populus x berolinensis TaxID=444605 RepID=A0AAD6M3J3_9ROSI|nr:hypothetical protein NC653_030021 [Populus alba x Populus x berolinensis]
MRSLQKWTYSPTERHRRIAHLQAKLFQAAADGAVRIKRRKVRAEERFHINAGINKGRFFAHVFLPCTGFWFSIWNFLGRVGGGYFSEAIIRKYAYPRPVAMAVVQVVMAIALFYYAMGWPGEIYVLSIFIGLVMVPIGQLFLPLPLSFWLKEFWCTV